MASKLDEMNGVVERVLEEADEDDKQIQIEDMDENNFSSLATSLYCCGFFL